MSSYSKYFVLDKYKPLSFHTLEVFRAHEKEDF